MVHRKVPTEAGYSLQKNKIRTNESWYVKYHFFEGTRFFLYYRELPDPAKIVICQSGRWKDIAVGCF
jgi:hypothetical protein